jgi:hypothetical protein
MTKKQDWTLAFLIVGGVAAWAVYAQARASGFGAAAERAEAARRAAAGEPPPEGEV